jgi:MFS transporter, FSR family, fosmidomycin resistance protein
VSLSAEQPSAAEARPGENRTMLLATLAAGHALKHVFNAGFYILLPEMKTALGLSNAAVGTISSVRNVAGGLANLPAGYVADRYSARFGQVLALVMVSIGVFQFMIGRSANFSQALIFSTLMLIAVSFWHPPAIGAISRIFIQRRGFAISIHGTGASIGEAIGPFLTGGLLVLVTWRVLLQWSLVPAVIASVLVWVLLKPRRVVAPVVSFAAYTRSFASLLTNAKLLAVLVIAGGFGAAQGVTFTFLPVYVREDLGQDPWVVGAYVSLAQVMGVVSQPIMGHLSDSLGRKTVIIPSMFGLGLGLLGLYIVGAGLPFLIILGATGAVLFSVMALVLAAAADLVSEEVQATSVSMMYLVVILFTGLSPVVAGFIADEYGVRSTFLMGAGLALAAGAFGLVSRWERK